MAVNLLENVNFSMVLKRAPNLEFFGKGVTLPSVSIAPVMHHSQVSHVKHQGDHMTFAPFDVTFRVDEGFLNYREVFEWMRSISAPEVRSQYGRSRSQWHKENPLVSDIDVVLFTSKSNSGPRFTFNNAWPTDLSSLVFDIEQETVTYSEATVTFEYDTFSVSLK